MLATFSDRMTWDPDVEILDQSSQTVPDMSLSVKEILNRFRRGTIDLDSLTRRMIDEEDDIDDDSLDGLHDLVDVMERKEFLNEKIRRNLQSGSSDHLSGISGTSEREDSGDPES